MIKKLMSMIMVIFTVAAMSGFSYAAIEEDPNQDMNLTRLRQNAVELGYPADTANELSVKDLTDLYQAKEEGREVNVSTCVLEIDSMEEIRDFLKYGAERMLKEGGNKEEILNAQADIDELFRKTDKELEKENGLSSAEVKVLREIQGGIKEKHEDKECDVTASGDLAQATCKVTVSCTSNGTKKRPVQYDVKATFNWKNAPLFKFSDKLVIAWGGDLNLDDNKTSATTRYYKNNGGDYGDFAYSYDLSDKEVKEYIQKGCKYTVKMKKTGSKYCKSGTANARIYQTKKEGKESKIITKYGHAKLATGLGGISISKTPGITFGVGYDSTNPAVKHVIKY